MRTATRRATVYGRRAGADWWAVTGQTCVASYKPIGEVDLATSYVNLATPGTYDAAPGTAPGLGAAGWVFVRASMHHLTTGIVVDTSLQAASIVMRFSNQSFDGGVGSLSFGWYINPDRIYYFNGGQKDWVPSLEGGVIAVAGNIGYRNGAAEAGTIPGASTNLPISIGALNNGGGVHTNYFDATIAALAIYSTTLSADDVAALTTRMAALT